MKIELNGQTHEFDERAPIDISIRLNFNCTQPNVYAVEAAVSKACEYGELVGDTRRGGSCNFEQVTLIPHCNGTHTECVGHVTNERISIRECLKDAFVKARLISVDPEFGSPASNDLVISRETLELALQAESVDLSTSALIIRTLPNENGKLSRQYIPKDSNDAMPPYFTAEAMHLVVQRGFRHLLVDLPSIDRLYDGGKLANHRIFWNIEDGIFHTNVKTRNENTITELIYVPDEIPDGNYLLNLQIAPFGSDAAPSRPIIFRLD